ncbi:MAG: hypothetical protein ACREMT_10810, partial [Vulcanimicrobiaceae bacterium]
MTSRTIARLGAVFVVLFSIIAGAQIYVQVFQSTELGASRFNPFHANVAQDRGTIVARDGTILAQSIGVRRVYPLGASLAQTVGYLSPRYGEAGLEESFDRFLAAPVAAANPVAQLHAILTPPQKRPRGATIVTTIDPSTQRILYASLSRYARAAGIVIDPTSGEVLALASVPSFDPNQIETIFA